MKKELLVASALAGTMGLAGVAEAATASFSGNVRAGVTGDDVDSTTTATHSADQKSSLSFSVSETTDAGTKIATSFSVHDEGTDDAGNPAGITLTFTDDSTLKLIEAGNAATGRIASVPGASGEQGISAVASSANAAPTAITWGSSSDNVGFTYTSAADSLVDGLTWGVSAAFGDDNDGTVSSTAETSYSAGITYTTTAGDTDITIGGGFINADDSNKLTINDKADVVMMSATAVTGDLTLGIGWGSGSAVDGNTTEIDSAQILTAGIKYVVDDDVTVAIGMVDAEAKDGTEGSAGTNTDTLESLSASVDYTVADGVTATVGYTDVSAGNEGASVSGNSGSSWYIGANISF